METAIEMIARLREEKKLLVDAILKVEDWAFGEGYFLTPSIKARFELVRKLVYNPADFRALESISAPATQVKSKRTYSMTPENKAAASERMRKYHAERRAKANNE